MVLGSRKCAGAEQPGCDQGIAALPPASVYSHAVTHAQAYSYQGNVQGNY